MVGVVGPLSAHRPQALDSSLVFVVALSCWNADAAGVEESLLTTILAWRRSGMVATPGNSTLNRVVAKQY
eukprot:scaffold4929_cov176-Amphora_coffeaeformis.AAC.18